jgi:hypothetical protein
VPRGIAGRLQQVGDGIEHCGKTLLADCRPILAVQPLLGLGLPDALTDPVALDLSEGGHDGQEQSGELGRDQDIALAQIGPDASRPLVERDATADAGLPAACGRAASPNR